MDHQAKAYLMSTVRQRVQMMTMGTAIMSVEPAICMQVVCFVCCSRTDQKRARCMQVRFVSPTSSANLAAG